MKAVIRVENPSGVGMFHSGSLGYKDSMDIKYIAELDDLLVRHNNFPSLVQDFELLSKLKEASPSGTDTYGNKEGFDYRFAFKNLDQFEKWVNRDEVATLHKYRFKVLKIVAAEVLESEYQCLINVNTIISKEDITELFLN